MYDIEAVENMLEESKKEKIARLKEEDKAIRNAHITNAMLKVASLPPIYVNNAEDLYNRAMEYFNICIEEGIKPTQEGLASAFKISTWTLGNWITGKTEKRKEVKEVLAWVHTTLQALTMQYTVEGQLNPITALFILKNNYGYTNDEKPIEVKEDSDKVDMEALRKKYELLGE